MRLWPSTKPASPSGETRKPEWRANIVAARNRSKIGRRGVFLSSISNLGHTLLDRELYLPRHWLEDRARCEKVGIPETVGFQTKCELARAMMERVHQAQIPVAWVGASTVYGNNLDLRT